MFCAHCGASNEENAYKCVACSKVLLRTGEAAAAGAPVDARGQPLGPATPRLAQSILVTIFCCQVAGIVAIVYSALAMGKNGGGDYTMAHKYARLANTWGWVGFGTGLLCILAYIAAIAAGAVKP